MNMQQLALSYLNQAGDILEEAESWLDKGRWNMVIRRSQEAVELAVKGALRWAGLEVPHWHDVGGLLEKHSRRFPDPFRERIPRIAEVSRKLREEREVSFYGDELRGIPPEELYQESDAAAVLKEARFVIAACKGLISTGREG